VTIKKEWQSNAPLLEEVLINSTPLQLSGQDEVLRVYTLGGTESKRDVRFLVDIETLEHLIGVAKQSNTRRAMIPSAGITLKVRRSRRGHVYETLHLDGFSPVPENLSTTLDTNISRTQFLKSSVINKWK